MLITLYPNREVRATVSKSHKHKTEPKTSHRELTSKVVPSYEVPFPVPKNEALYLDIPSVLSGQEKTPPAPRRSMGVYARRRALRLGACFAPAEERRSSFVTGTLPGSTKAALGQFARQSGKVVKLIQDAIRSWCKVREIPIGNYLWVWELQKRGALHWHGCIEWPEESIAAEFIAYWPKLWQTVLKNIGQSSPKIFDRRGGGTWENNPEVWQSDAEVVQKDVGRYLSKYLSKELQQQKDVPLENCPHGRWWGCSHSLRETLEDFVNKNTVYLPIEISPGEDMEMIGGMMTAMIEEYSDGTARDVSPWFQSHTKQAFGFIKEGVDFIKDFIPRVTELLPFIATQWAFPDGMSWSYLFELDGEMDVNKVNPDRRESAAGIDGPKSARLPRHPSAPPGRRACPAASSP